jgi:hypothetical protein
MRDSSSFEQLERTLIKAERWRLTEGRDLEQSRERERERERAGAIGSTLRWSDRSEHWETDRWRGAGASFEQSRDKRWSRRRGKRWREEAETRGGAENERQAEAEKERFGHVTEASGRTLGGGGENSRAEEEREIDAPAFGAVGDSFRANLGKNENHK